MESLLNRYRNITVLLLVVVAQLVLLAVQVKNDQDVRMIRVWTVTAVTPVARVIEGFRGGGLGFLRNYVMLHDVNAENRRLQTEIGRLKVENIFLKNELNTAERAKALQVFQGHTLSKTLAATVILASAGSSASVRFLDRGSFSGVQRGMAVVTPDGIVGKIVNAYPSASEMLMVTDPEFAAGVMSQNGQVHGTMKGQGNPTLCKVDYVPFQEKVEVGDMLYTSGEDRIFPRGFPVGVVKEVRNGQPFKEIYVQPVGILHGVEDVLIILEGVHEDIPSTPPANQPVYVAPAPAGPAGQTADPQAAAPPGTEADKLRLQYKNIGDTQNHIYGAGGPGSKPPDFTRLNDPNAPVPNKPPAAGQQQLGAPPQTPGGNSQPAGAGRSVVPGRQSAPPKTPGANPPANTPAGAGRTGVPGQQPAAAPKTPGANPQPSGAGRSGVPGQQPTAPPKTPGANTPAGAGRGGVPGQQPAAPPKTPANLQPAATAPAGGTRPAVSSPQAQPPAPVRRANQAAGPGGNLPE